ARRLQAHLRLEPMEERWALSQLTGRPAAINYGDGVENVFVATNDVPTRDLYVNHYDPNLGWSWRNLGNGGVDFLSDPAVINYGSHGFENVFISGYDGHLHLDHFDPNTGWNWFDQGNPVAGGGLVSKPAVVNYGNGYEWVFVYGDDGNLYVDQYDPFSGWGWHKLG